jgi:hypothetical protein
MVSISFTIPIYIGKYYKYDIKKVFAINNKIPCFVLVIFTYINA